MSSRRGPCNTHHNLRKGLQGGLELVGGREGVRKVHGPGQDEQRRRDLLVQVQLQPLEVGGGDPDSPAGLIPPTFPVTRARASGPGTSLFVLVCVGEGRRRTLVATTTAAPEWADPYVPRASSPGRDPASSEGPIYRCANAHCLPQSRDTPQRGRCANAHCPPQSREQETLRSEAAGLIKH